MTYELIGSYLVPLYVAISAFLTIFCVSYNMNPPNTTRPPYVTNEWMTGTAADVAGKNIPPVWKKN